MGSQALSHTKVSRQDWLDAALGTLISRGVEHVKILTLAQQLGVSRSSFYWYFADRGELVDALLAHWQDTNTKALIEHASAPAATVTEAFCNIFLCFITPGRFDTQLDFAIREWARRSEAIHAVLRASDEKRIDALRDTFRHFGYAPQESLVRARTFYYMQIGYNDSALAEPVEDRLALTRAYIHCFTGQYPSDAEVEALNAQVRRLASQGAP